jgi:enoyl-CoA hydratase
VVVLRGEGSAFCAGADLTGVEDHGFHDALTAVLAALSTAPLVTIAAVDGPALGAGTQLAIACDLRVATERSRFGIPAAKLGLVVDHWTVHRLAELTGPATASSMLLTAATVDAAAAHAAGWVQRMGTPDDAMAWADEIGGLAPLTIAAHKLGLRTALGDAGFVAARDAAWASADAVEGRTAFLDKRPARFTGR